ncbi:MAG: hypothetical protein ACWGO1_11590 [Anaerolineales bacterium]
MNGKMYIPCSITLTEHEYLLVQQLAHQLAPSSYAFSAAIRHIIREWEKQHLDRPTPDIASDPADHR